MKRSRDWLFGVIATLFGVALIQLLFQERLAGLTIDYLFVMRDALVGERYTPDESKVVIVAIDEETYKRKPFSDMPRIMWTPQYGRVQQAVVKGGAKVVGYDMIFPTSVSKVIKNYDKEFLKALLINGRKQGKVVLAKAQHQNRPLAPFPAQAFMIGGSANIRSVNLKNDPDDIVRRAPLLFEAVNQDGSIRIENSMSMELVSRVLGQKPVWQEGQNIQLGDMEIPGTADRNIIINFDRGHDIPTYSFADLAACEEQGNTAFFEEHFKDKVVMVGVILDVEDRKLTSKRTITAEETAPGMHNRCVLEPMLDIYRFDLIREVIPGVFTHATAVNNMLRQDFLAEMAPHEDMALMFVVALMASLSTVFVRPIFSGGFTIALNLGWAYASTMMFAAGVVPPFLGAIAASLIAFTIMLGYRFIVIDRDRNFLKGVFGLYLAPELIDRIVESEELPTMAGERRELTYLFTDVAGFTTMSETADPEKVGQVLNEYLDGVVAVVLRNDGTLIQFIGDAVFAFFGAPVDDPEHAVKAARCALEIDQFSEEFIRLSHVKELHFGITRIGVHSGAASIGNFGGSNRFSYTAIGDSVNTAARIEGANKYFGTRCALSQATVEKLPEKNVRLIARVVLKGRHEPLALYQPVSAEEMEQPHIQSYNKAMDMLEAGDESARDLFYKLEEYYPTDPLIEFHCNRLRFGHLSSIVELEGK